MAAKRTTTKTTPKKRAARPAAPKNPAKVTRLAKRVAPKPATGSLDGSASRLIDERIRDLGGWRGETLARMRGLIRRTQPEAVEEWKWMGTPVWSLHGIICTGEAYAKVVKLTFARGATTPDPRRLFNSSLDGNVRRAIDIHEGETVDDAAFTALVNAAVAENLSAKAKKK